MSVVEEKLLQENGDALLKEDGGFIILKRLYTMLASVGTYVLTGISVGFIRGYILVCAVGAYTLTGIAAGLYRGYTLVANVGTYILTGIDIVLRAKFGRYIIPFVKIKNIISSGSIRNIKPFTNIKSNQPISYKIEDV